jgi:PAS domain-containing protein
VVAYKIELLNKQAFLGKESSEKTFYRWLRIFETFPEGLALIRNGQIIYANKALTQLFELKDYDSSNDPYNDELKDSLRQVELKRLGGEKSYTTTAWGFIEGAENGAPFSLTVSGRDKIEGLEENSDGTQNKFVSLNKVIVNLSGTRDKMFVVRDLSSMVSL